MHAGDGRPYHSNVFHELKTNGGTKVEDDTEREPKQNSLPDKMVEQTNPSEHSFIKAEHQNGDKAGKIRTEDVSYDKDVVEIKFPDVMVSSNYGEHFVKDVCIDEGVLADQKDVAEKVYPDLGSSMGDTNGDPMKEIAAEPVKSVHDLTSQIVVLPEACATNGNTVEQYSCKLQDLEGNNTITIVSAEKSGPKQLVSNDGATFCQQLCTDISESSENHEPILDGEAINQVSSNDFHETGASIVSETTQLNGVPVESTADGLSEAATEDDVASVALNKGGFNQINHYNPFIAYGSLEDTWEPQYSLPTIVDDASMVPCPVEKTDSFSDLVNCALLGFNYLEINESITEDGTLNSVEANSSRADVQASEENNNQRGNPVEKMDSSSDLIDSALGGFDSTGTDEARNEDTQDSRLDSIEESSSRSGVQPLEDSSNNQADNFVDGIRIDAAHGMSSVTPLLTGNTEASDVKSENNPKCEIDSVGDAHDFNPREADNGTNRSEDNEDSKISTVVQTESVPDSAKVTARTVIRNPFESSFSGPSITSGPLTPSGHIAYSGNISLRSDSSTTSTRSFAFPVLQTEWSSSPVKMAKADRRRLRRDRGCWGYRILCCKF
ncbi:hypothetical protein GUJ93_ZPchr0014g47409 [Zizania palustris]|uniref:Uncharacterized protein n=1 Tax=Zizania palustris TaxID=103762 RepID=A0A8J5TBA6_ZIZPA|nr:hypothetical protein GUJ93_ZPchr0014g47409 [Zizania palustris]